MISHETRLEEMASVIVGETLEGWTFTSATVKREDLHPWVRLTLLAKAVNGKGDVNTFRYEAGRPLNQLARWGLSLLPDEPCECGLDDVGPAKCPAHKGIAQ